MSDPLPAILSAFAALPPGRRLIALAGPPGSGKSTLAERLAAAGACAVLPMDGFHYDDAVLEARGMRARKGAPETFDLAGLDVMLGRLAAGGAEVAVPVFDRGLEIARAGARIVGPEIRHVLVEGNYLLLDRPGWRDLSRHFALTLALRVDEATLRDRLEARWRDLGLAADQVAAKVEGNDLPNARLVLTQSRAADIRIG